ncbi:DUF2637 domain-containing protein [Streptomyces hoynatensis]|uniref:DUF2637 domain-containing protein n=1 Tax=Streptomyces hoynatensis TaxID=1141874 RepID=A0A3A9ZFU1_9ACTN|nr:DUF2637 domain-containing protein [Streptomyces hoynatensis]RKN47143.1 DUF2637 domain-containing protein [Streptomyces hoynatensis]
MLHDEETHLLIPPELRATRAGWGIAGGFGDAEDTAPLADTLRPVTPPSGRHTAHAGPVPPGGYAAYATLGAEQELAGQDLSPHVPLAPHGAPAPHPGHRRARPRQSAAGPSLRVRWLRWASLLLSAVASALVAMLSVLGGLISYEPLRAAAATGAPPSLTAWWPLLIYGPWLVASMSILRAALHQKRVTHSWAVVIFFSGLAVALCVAQAPATVTDIAVAGLPPVSALVAFHQIVRQITLISPPRHAFPRQRPVTGRG